MTVRTTTVPAEGVRHHVSTGRLLARAVAAEWLRLWTVRSAWWFLAVTTVALVGLGTLLGFESAADAVELHGEPAWMTARAVAVPAQIAFLGLALVAVTSDYATGGIITTLQWTPRRGVLFVARTLVTVGAAAGLGVLLAVACAVAAFTTAGSALTLTVDDGIDMVGWVAFVLTAGAVSAVGLGFLLRNTAGALISVFLLILVLPLLLPVFGEWMATAARGLPGSGAIFLLIGQVSGMSVTSSVVVMLAWAVGLLLLGWLRLMRDDANS